MNTTQQNVHVDLINLTDVVRFFKNKGMNATASYSAGCRQDTVTVHGLIDADFVKRHVGEFSDIWKELLEYTPITNQVKH